MEVRDSGAGGGRPACCSHKVWWVRVEKVPVWGLTSVHQWRSTTSREGSTSPSPPRMEWGAPMAMTVESPEGSTARSRY